MSATQLVVLSAGLREPSTTQMLGQRLGAATVAALERQGVQASTHEITLRPLARSIADALTTGFAPQPLEDAFTALANAHGVIAVTPAFNASFSGLFKSFFDVLPEQSLADMPVLIAATGGTDRHSLVLEHAMRPMFAYLHAIVSPTGVYAATDDFGAAGLRGDGSRGEGQRGNGPSVGARIEKAAADFTRLLTSCSRPVARDEFTDQVDSMAAMLSRAQGS